MVVLMLAMVLLMGLALVLVLLRRSRAPYTTTEIDRRMTRREARAGARDVALRSLQDELEALRRGGPKRDR